MTNPNPKPDISFVNLVDWEALLPHAIRLLRELHDFNSQFDQSFTPKNFEQRIRQEFIHSAYGSGTDKLWLLAYLGSQEVGVTVASVHYNLFSKYIEIESLFVVEEFRRQGIASALVRQVVSWAEEKNIDDIRLFVSEDNKKALDFYHKIGFTDLQRVLRLKLGGVIQ